MERELVFFKILLGPYRSQMRIPPAFARQFGFEPKRYMLQGPRSNVKVKAEKIDGDWCFGGEWARFAEDHSMGDGEILFFKYVGESTFFVRLYGRDCGEKGGSVNLAAPKFALSSSTQNDNCQNAAIKFASESKLNGFWKVLSEAYVTRGYLSIPAEFYRDFMKGKVKDGEDIELERSGSVWGVRVTVPPGRTGRLTSGWYNFQRDNLLGEGDACVFELVDTEELLLKVTCFYCK